MKTILLFLVFTTIGFAQPIPPDSVWTFAFDDGGDEYFYDALELDDGYLLCGEAREWNALAGEALLVKIDRDGELVWERTYPNSEFRRFRHFHYVLTAENFEIGILGEMLSPSGISQSVFEELLDGNGDSIYLHSICSLPPELGTTAVVAKLEWANHESTMWPVITTSYYTANDSAAHRRYLDGGCPSIQFTGEFEVTNAYENDLQSSFYCGYTRHPSDSIGTQGFMSEPIGQSELIFGGSENDRFNAVLRRPNQRLWAFGWSESFTNGARDLWAVGYSFSPGVDPISRHYGGLSNEDAVEAFLASDNGYVIAGNFSSEDIEFEQSDFWLLKVDENGDSVWSVLAGGEEADRCEGMIETENGFMLFGSSQSFAVPGWDGCAMLLAYVPDLAAAPSSLNFGPVAVGDSATRLLNLVNTGSNTLTVTEILGTDAYHANFAGPVTIALGETLAVDVMFAPPSAGTQVDTLRVMSDAISGEKIVRCLGAGTAADADEQSLLPTEFKLHPPYPNPFNATAVLNFELPTTQQVTLELFDVTGRLMTTLVSELRQAGSYRVNVDASNFASGIYFVALRAGDDYAVQKLLLVK